jgi:hypothetical protein
MAFISANSHPWALPLTSGCFPEIDTCLASQEKLSVASGKFSEIHYPETHGGKARNTAVVCIGFNLIRKIRALQS